MGIHIDDIGAAVSYSVKPLLQAQNALHFLDIIHRFRDRAQRVQIIIAQDIILQRLNSFEFLLQAAVILGYLRDHRFGDFVLQGADSPVVNDHAEKIKRKKNANKREDQSFEHIFFPWMIQIHNLPPTK
ncbi:hypothetical protein D3C77_498000 [compost metagenome]